MKKNQTKQIEHNTGLEALTSLEWLDEDNIKPMDVDVSFLSWLDIDDEILETLDTTTKNKIKKKKYILIGILCLLVLFTSVFVLYRVNVYHQTVIAYEQEDKPVLVWLRAFVNGDFTTCDALSRDSESKLTTSQSKYYGNMMQKASNSITNVEVKKILDTREKICYTIEVTYKEYKSNVDKEAYDKEYEELKKAYFSDDLTDAEIEEKLRVLYNNTYKTGFTMSNEKKTFEVELYSDEKGVGNINQFIRKLITKTKVKDVSNEILDTLSGEKGTQVE